MILPSKTSHKSISHRHRRILLLEKAVVPRLALNLDRVPVVAAVVEGAAAAIMTATSQVTLVILSPVRLPTQPNLGRQAQKRPQYPTTYKGRRLIRRQPTDHQIRKLHHQQLTIRQISHRLLRRNNNLDNRVSQATQNPKGILLLASKILLPPPIHRVTAAIIVARTIPLQVLLRLNSQVRV